MQKSRGRFARAPKKPLSPSTQMVYWLLCPFLELIQSEAFCTSSFLMDRIVWFLMRFERKKSLRCESKFQIWIRFIICESLLLSSVSRLFRVVDLAIWTRKVDICFCEYALKITGWSKMQYFKIKPECQILCIKKQVFVFNEQKIAPNHRTLTI